MPVQTANLSNSWTFFEGRWHEGNVAIMGPRTHAAWQASIVFDGARAFEGVAPDLDLHCARVNQSALALGLKPITTAEDWLGLILDGIKRFAPETVLYLRPMYWADSGLGGGVRVDPDTTRWCACLYEAPMPEPIGASLTLSPYRKPTAATAPVAAKAACLYPNNSKALEEASARGFENCLLRDANGNIAELANANIFMAKDGVVLTPAPNGTFLNGITRKRVIALLLGDGLTVIEKALTYGDFLTADEIFSAGNFNKVSPMTRIDGRELEIGPVYRRARKLYWDFAHANKL
jgi:branched-chain amino acid aminotransferase